MLCEKIFKEKEIGQKEIDSLKIERSLLSDAYFQLKKTTKELERSEERFRIIFNNSRDGILLAEISTGRFVRANQAICSMLGRKLEEVEKLSVPDIHPVKDMHFAIKQFRDLVKGKISIARNIPVKRKDGSIFYADISGSVVQINEKKYIIGVFRDNTEHRYLEEAIKESEKKYSTFVEQSSDGVLVIQDGLIKFGNKAIQSMTGYRIKEVINHSIQDFIVDKYKKMVAERYVRHIKGLPTINRYEFEIVRKNGRELFVETNSSLIDFEGRPAVMAIIRDISRAKQIDKMKSEFISIASHQLRGPLTGVKWFSQLLIDKKAGELSVKQTNLIQQIHDSNERMICLVNDLLDVSRIESGQNLMIKKKPGNIVSLVNKAISDCKIVSSKSISIRLDKGLVRHAVFNFDSDKIYQVISNLINNSIKYSVQDKKITVSLKRLGNELQFSVKDHGFGIPEHQQDRIFQRFFRADNISTVSTEGSGLGLYIAKGIIEAHGGKIWFKSKQDKGTTFYFTLPFKEKR